MPQPTITRVLPEWYLGAALRADARAGLTASPKSLPPKWFYDANGSALFDKITELQEYYPTRAERAILRSAASEIAATSQAHTLVELGSGSSTKTRLLLDAMRAAGTLRHYIPIDVSQAALLGAGQQLNTWYPHLRVLALLADFTAPLELTGPTSERRMFAFL